MSRRIELYHWKAELASHFPGLSFAFVALLASWSFGIVLARTCGLDSVALQLVRVLGQSFSTVRQRLREFYQPAQAKAGSKRGIKRRDFEASECFAPLLGWVLSFWTHKRLAVALDATNLGDRMHILCVSVLFGGVGIPVAWKILPGNEKEAWNPHWESLLKLLRRSAPDDWQVLVLSDRGLESAHLFRAIAGLGWHPLMRAKNNGTFRPQGWKGWYAMASFVPHRGKRFAMRGSAYKTAGDPLRCTLMACWDEGYQDPWLILTDLGPAAANPCWYGFRTWIEQGFKVIKSEGLQWQGTRMSDPGRMERMWLAIAVSTLWLVAIGAEVERAAEVETIGPVPAPGAKGRGRPARRHRLFKVGLAEVLARLVKGEPLPLPREKLPEEPWPQAWHDCPTITEDEFLLGKTYP